MEFIKHDQAVPGKNSEICKTLEYSFQDKDLDLGIATITGRFPDRGYVINTISKELIYVLEGTGAIYFENRKVVFSKGDCILIEPNEKYYWDSKYCVVAMACTPAWSPEQHQSV